MAPNRMTNASQQRCYFQETVVNEHLKISNCAKFYVEFSKNVQRLFSILNKSIDIKQPQILF